MPQARSKDSYNTSKYHVLDKLRKARKLEIIDLCRQLEISTKHYDRIKLDFRGNLSMNKLFSLASLLKYTPEQLLCALIRNKPVVGEIERMLSDDLNEVRDITNGLL